jgi:hypothetical protein
VTTAVPEDERVAAETGPMVAGLPPRGSFSGARAEAPSCEGRLPLFLPFLRMPTD